jgi:hypothetical protein
MRADFSGSLPPADEATAPMDRVSLGLLVVAGLLFLCKAFLALNGVFEVDEFDVYNQGLALLDDPAARLAMPHKLLAAVVFSAGVLLGEQDPVIGLMVNRTVVIVANVAIYLAVLRLAERAFGRLAAFHALIGLGMVFIFVDHSFTARVDFLSLTAYVVALALLLERRTWSLPLAGLVMGLAIYLSFKSSLMLASVLAALVVVLWQTRPWRKAAVGAGLFLAGFALPHLVYLGLRAALAATASTTVEAAAQPVQVLAHIETSTAWGQFYFSALRQNPAFFGVAAVGLGLAAWRWFRGDELRDDARVLVVAVAVYTAAVVAYPQAWPYFLATAVPGLALLWGSLCGEVHRQLARAPTSALHVGALTLLVVLGVLRPLDRVRYDLSMDNAYQVAVIDRLSAVVEPGGAYFDGVGMVPTLHHTPNEWLDVVNLEAHQRDPERMERLLRVLAEGETEAIVMNERTENLPQAFLDFRDRYFAHDWGNIYTPGRILDTGEMLTRPGILPAITAGTYHVRGDPEAWHHLRVDGVALRGPTVTLTTGDHLLETDRDVGVIRVQRYRDGFEEDREPLDGYRPLFPKESSLLEP